jgi:hypothetical protein
MHSGPIHQRTIIINTFETDHDTLIIEGTLIDDRLCKTFIYLLSTIADPKIVHHIILRIEVSLPDLSITSVNTDMHEVPHEVCKDIHDIGDKLIGISLLNGFNSNISKLIGGKKGCLHLYNLLLSMRSAAFQGLFTYLSRVQEDGSLRQLDFDESLLVNTCHVWSESGPFASQVEEMKKRSQARRTEKVNPAD